MNILLAMPWDQHQGGVTHVAASLARSFEAHGHRAYFVFPSDRWLLRHTTTRRGFPAVQCRFRSYPPGHATVRGRLSWYSVLFTTLPQLEWFARSRRIDVINIHYLESGFALLSNLARRLRLPLVVSAHGSDLLTESGPCCDEGLMRLLHSADAVVVPSLGYLRSILTTYPAVGKKIHCIHNGYEHAEFPQMPQLPRAKDECGPVALCIAAHTHKKGLDVLLRALQACGTKSLKLRLVGDGPLRAQLEAQAAALAVTHRVSFLGSRSRQEVIEELSRCDMLVMPSRHASESFGLAALEAMACGKPVVASAVGGLPELVSDGETGLLVPQDDAVALARALDVLATSPLLRCRMGEAGRSKAQRFTASATADKYEALFARLVSRTPAVATERAKDR